MFNQFKKILLLAGDIIFLYVSLYIVLMIRYLTVPGEELWDKHFLPFTFIFLIWLIIFFIYDLYRLQLASQRTKFYKNSVQAFFTAGLISIIYFYISPHTNITPKTNLVVFIAVFALVFLLWRSAYYLAIRSYLPKEKVALIGKNEQVVSTIKELKEKQLGYKISFILNPFFGEKQEIENIPVFKKTEDLHHLISKKNINTLVLATDPTASEELRNTLFSSLHLKVNFVTLPQFYENITGKIPLDIIDQTWFLQNLSEGRKTYFDIFKRSYDFLLGSIIFLVTLPLWLLIALAIKLTSRGPIFFKQTRAGQYGRPFKMVKFRTMTTTNNDLRATREKDDRITKVGAFLRKTRLDELPQMINVLKGEASFVGPRPERPEFIQELEKKIPFYRERMLVKPGITGWDQISGEYHSPSLEDTWKKLQYDLFYIKNRSVYLDLSIILKTIATIVSKAGR